MAKQTDTPGRNVPTFEPHLLVRANYGEYLAIPASLASQVLPHLKCVSQDYDAGTYVYTLKDPPSDFTLVSAEKMMAAAVKAKLEAP